MHANSGNAGFPHFSKTVHANSGNAEVPHFSKTLRANSGNAGVPHFSKTLHANDNAEVPHVSKALHVSNNNAGIPHVLKHDSGGRDSPLIPFAMGNTFVTNADDNSTLNITSKGVENSDTDNVNPVASPPIPIFQNDSNHNQNLHSYAMTPEQKGRNSLIDVLGIGTPFVGSAENRQSNISSFYIFPRMGETGVTASVKPIGLPPLPIFQSEHNQSNEHSNVSHSVAGNSACGVTPKPVGIQSVARQAGGADGAFGAISEPVQNHGTCFGIQVGASGAISGPSRPDVQRVER